MSAHTRKHNDDLFFLPPQLLLFAINKLLKGLPVWSLWAAPNLEIVIVILPIRLIISMLHKLGPFRSLIPKAAVVFMRKGSS